MVNWLPSYKTLCALCAVLVISACARPDPPIIEVQTQVVVPEVPRSNLVCPVVPTPPDPDTATQRDIAVYLPEVIEVAEHCRRDLGVVRTILDNAADAAQQPEQ